MSVASDKQPRSEADLIEASDAWTRYGIPLNATAAERRRMIERIELERGGLGDGTEDQD